ncbi:Uncharacterized conserved protein UCP009193 [Zea mays]|uniref:Uncharacterized conserved protein UCP009193 n=1 Tax=Zea mays TaxID=4577 RepID=A0A1D6I2U6_MAIZE|nr:Uncharacterized conserved protein UCP009193 [Zea mays]
MHFLMLFFEPPGAKTGLQPLIVSCPYLTKCHHLVTIKNCRCLKPSSNILQESVSTQAEFQQNRCKHSTMCLPHSSIIHGLREF